MRLHEVWPDWVRVGSRMIMSLVVPPNRRLRGAPDSAKLAHLLPHSEGTPHSPTYCRTLKEKPVLSPHSQSAAIISVPKHPLWVSNIVLPHKCAHTPFPTPPFLVCREKRARTSATMDMNRTALTRATPMAPSLVANVLVRVPDGILASLPYSRNTDGD